LYKLKKHELKECQKILNDHIQKAQQQPPQQHQQQQFSPGQQQQQPGISPTPSPAGSEGSVCSKSSGYNSSGEQQQQQQQQPPSPGSNAASHQQQQQQQLSLMSVPKNVMQLQYTYCQYLSQCHELWEYADMYASRGKCSGKDHCTMLCLQLALY